jgi:hypothetical protein
MCSQFFSSSCICSCSLALKLSLCHRSSSLSYSATFQWLPSPLLPLAFKVMPAGCLSIMDVPAWLIPRSIGKNLPPKATYLLSSLSVASQKILRYSMSLLTALKSGFWLNPLFTRFQMLWSRLGTVLVTIAALWTIFSPMGQTLLSIVTLGTVASSILLSLTMSSIISGGKHSVSTPLSTFILKSAMCNFGANG